MLRVQVHVVEEELLLMGRRLKRARALTNPRDLRPRLAPPPAEARVTAAP